MKIKPLSDIQRMFDLVKKEIDKHSQPEEDDQDEDEDRGDEEDMHYNNNGRGER